MSYTKTQWKNRAVEKPSTYTITSNGDGTSTLTPAPGTITEAGTPITADAMNNIENKVEELDKKQPVVSSAEPSSPLAGQIFYRVIS